MIASRLSWAKDLESNGYKLQDLAMSCPNAHARTESCLFCLPIWSASQLIIDMAHGLEAAIRKEPDPSAPVQTVPSPVPATARPEKTAGYISKGQHV